MITGLFLPSRVIESTAILLTRLDGRAGTVLPLRVNFNFFRRGARDGAAASISVILRVMEPGD